MQTVLKKTAQCLIFFRFQSQVCPTGTAASYMEIKVGEKKMEVARREKFDELVSTANLLESGGKVGRQQSERLECD